MKPNYGEPFEILEEIIDNHQIKNMSNIFNYGPGLGLLNIIRPQYTCILLKGSIVVMTEKIDKITFDKNLKVLKDSKKIFYLSPNTDIERKSNVIYLRRLEQKSNNNGFINSWFDCDKYSKNISLNKINLIFYNEEKAIKWEKWIKEEINFPHLSRFCMTDYDPLFISNLNGYIWQMILHGNESVKSFYFNITFELDLNNLPLEFVDPYRSCYKIFNRILQLVDSLCPGENQKKRPGTEYIVAYLIYRMSKDKMDRLLILLCEFDIVSVKSLISSEFNTPVAAAASSVISSSVSLNSKRKKPVTVNFYPKRMTSTSALRQQSPPPSPPQPPKWLSSINDSNDKAIENFWRELPINIPELR
jgi:hypothetical protein